MHKPGEENFEKVINEYFQGAIHRYADRIRAQKSSKSMQPGHVERIMDINALMAIYDEFIILMKYFKGTPDKIVNGRLIKGSPGAWQGVWKRAGLSSLRKILRMAKVPEPADFVWGQQDFADYQMEQAVSQIVNTTGKEISERVQKGLLDGASIDDIAKSIQDIKVGDRPGDRTFGYGRARMIARTETTNAITGAQLRSFEAAKTDFGIKLKKAWVANRDARTREEHLDLETKYGRDDQAIDTTEMFRVSTYAGSGPGKFGVAEMDINCRCAVIPVVIR